ncbi:hypothetical protein ACFVXE_08615 [Streptomyces sp. NPDC058231]|uniref:hypothetical protein n=1 Tax=Streptomyces sp. NPDC058231 TaxID=3346392 RepID=UPI0036EA7627
MNDKSVQLVYQIAVVAISVAGYVALAIAGEVTAEYVALIGPVLGAAALMTRLGKQDQVLGEIHENTNGVLKQKIRDAVTEALNDRAGN